MAWLTFGTQTSPEPMSNLDLQFRNVTQWSIIDATATGTNAITLAPTLTGFTAAAYANYVSYRFIAANTSAGSVTLRVSALAALNVYYQDGTTQVGASGVTAGYAYMATFNSTLNSSAGGWYLTPIGSSASTIPDPVPVVNGGTGQITAAAARGSSGLNIDQATSTSFNVDSSIAATARTVISSTTAMSGGHTLTLPLASAVNAGQEIDVLDLNGVTGSQTLTIGRAGSDTINGATSIALATQYGGWRLKSDGTSKWTAQYLSPTSSSGVAAGNGISVSGSTVSINTNNGVGVGAYAMLYNVSAGSIASGSTASSAGLAFPALTDAAGTVIVSSTSGPSGTWRNIAGWTMGNGAIGLWIRTV